MTNWNANGVPDTPVHFKHQVGRMGHFALQLHAGNELRVRFNDIMARPPLKRLVA